MQKRQSEADNMAEKVVQRRKIYIETYGCQMNVADTEIINGILHREGYEVESNIESADAIFLNTCAIRDHAEQRIYGRLSNFEHLKKRRPHLVVGVLGCMAERLRTHLLEESKLVDVVCGPDEYRKLPALIDGALLGEKGIQIQLSRSETYDDIEPLRTEGISAWISVMRGCDKFCTFCVVPFTRGRERSRSMANIVHEIEILVARGFKEVTLLGQNVNSYLDEGNDFADLLVAAAGVDPSLRVRFTTSHPQDMSDKLIAAIAAYDNICSYIHLPLQSGSDRILELMNRNYSAADYLDRIGKIRETIPGVALSTDIITGFPTETEDDHRATLEMMRKIQYDSAFTFKYSARENTKAWKMGDDIPEEIKGRRLEEIIELQRHASYQRNVALVGSTQVVLVEGRSKRSDAEWMGRTDTNKTVIFPAAGYEPGDYISVRVDGATSATLFGTVLRHGLEIAA
ncbi:MAG: tRNA (N6-isopentenyl adenosine(37)-C2)-methylthiotransferase MiaB [Ignavibacteriae bacterium]|nr:tRNA (N6-isopentenyl adenosine(37)-C2)-methylthiotransferase MiaB [Ignavibacteriota bacterium]